MTIKTNSIPEHLSNKQFIDTDTSSNGCIGGVSRYSIRYYIHQTGLVLESEYPYNSGLSDKSWICKNQIVLNNSFSKY